MFLFTCSILIYTHTASLSIVHLQYQMCVYGILSRLDFNQPLKYNEINIVIWQVNRMARGVIYCMTTIVPGLVKIGKTRTDQFEQRMYQLENNGYRNIVGLKRRFAIEVEDYDEKEVLLHDIFSKSNVPSTELFALDADLVVQLLASLDGEQIYPRTITKEDAFDTAADERQMNAVTRFTVPAGTYYLDTEHGRAKMRVEGKKFIVEKGSPCQPCEKDWMPEARRSAVIENGILQKDVPCNSPSTAGWVVLGRANNGRSVWRNSAGKPIDVYRTHTES